MKRLVPIILLIASGNVLAADPYEFANPSFSGIGFSAHILTQEQMRQRSQDEARDRKEAAERDLEREIENSNVNRFINNFESRVYAQLSKQLVDALFGEDPSTSGSFDLAGNMVVYESDGVTITLTITNPDGTVTTISIPVGGLGI